MFFWYLVSVFLPEAMQKVLPNIFIKKVIPILLWGYFLYPLSGLCQAEDAVQNKYFFNVGLQGHTVQCILQDSQGFLWVGTNDGLYQYDGYTFEGYRHDPNDDNTLSNNHIRDLYEDKEGRIWIGTYGGGINILGPDRSNFTHYYNNPDDNTSLSFDEITDFFEDSQGRLWIGTDGGGVNQYLWEKDVFLRYQHRESDTTSLSHNNVLALSEDDDGYLWAGTWHGLNRMNTQTGRCLRFYHNPDDPASLSSNHVWAVYQIAPRQFWIGVQSAGVNLLDAKTGKVQRSPLKTESTGLVRVIRKSTENRAWIGGSAGLEIADTKQQTITTRFQNPANPDAHTVWAVEKSDDGIVWIGTTNGLYKADPNNKDFQFHRFFPAGNSENQVHTIYQDTIGIFWAGTPQGLLRYAPGTGKQQLFSPGQTSSVTAFCTDQRGFFWVGTHAGLYRFYPQHGRFELFDSEKFNTVSSRNIREIYADSKGTVWVGTILGMNKISFTNEGPKVTRYENDPDDPHSLVYSHHTSVILEDREGTLWIGTNGGGISRFDPEKEKFTRYLYDVDDPTTLSNNFVECMYEAANGTLWIGTQAGLNKFDKENGTFRRYTTANGLNNYHISSILEDEQGKLWISTRSGSTQGDITQFDPQTESFTHYDTGDGLIANVFVPKASWKANKGTLYFGSESGMVSFHPNSIQKNTHIPPIVITEFSLFNEPVVPGKDSPLQKNISRTASLELAHYQSSFSFEFVALNYTNTKKNQYAYKLEGFDKEWNFVNTGRKAIYTNVKPGEYVFKVKGTNNDGVWNETGTSVRVTVLPPFWQTTVAYMLYILLAGILLFGLYRYFLNRERRKNYLALERLQMVQAQELNQLKIRFFTHISHEIRTPLTLILSPIEKMLASAQKQNTPWKKQLVLVHRNALRLQNLVNELMDFRKIESGSLKLEPASGDLVIFARNVFEAFLPLATERQMLYQFCPADEKTWACFDTDKLEKILNNLLSNALKYTPKGGKITLEISTKEPENGAEPMAKIVVKDTGMGIAANDLPHIFEPFYQANAANPHKQASTGIGLALTHELVKLHRGKIDVQSKLDKGTVFTVLIPLAQPDAYKMQKSALPAPEKYPTEDDTENGTLEEKTLPLLLIVDDNADIRQFIHDNFSSQFQVIEAANGKAALKLAIEKTPDMVISDVLMPVMDGIAFCKKLRSNEQTSHIPVILLTASHSESTRLKAMAIGADDYLHKPFNIFLLKARVQNLLDRRKQLRQRFSREVRLQPKDVTVSNVDEKFLQSLMEVVEEHIDDTEFNVSVLCKKTGTSRPQLYRKLQALTGQTVHDFIRTVRLKRAAQLLESGQLPVAEVAYRVGFNDPQYFSRCFKKQFGKPPSKISA